MVNKKMHLIHLTLLATLTFLAIDVHAATWYVDSSATGANNGTSWTNAWTSLSSTSAASAGDTVYISGGSTGSTRTYTLTSEWTPKGGSSGNPITYKIGQDSSHNGTAIFSCSGGNWIGGTITYVVISGDAGDGQMHFQISNMGGYGVECNQTGAHDFRISYVNFGRVGGGLWLQNVYSVEVDHCYVYKTGGAEWTDNVIRLNNTVYAWDNTKLHHNTFYMPRSDSGSGDDCVQQGGGGVSFYSNTVIAYLDNYQGGQHSDGVQPTNGSYLKYYNNYFRDIANYAIYIDAYYSGFSDVLIYNNIIVLTSSALQRSAPPKGIAIGSDQTPQTFNRVVVANNLIVDYGGNLAIHMDPIFGGTYTNCYMVNNYGINSGGFAAAPSGIVTSNNISIASGTGHVVEYTALSPNNDFHLSSSDTSFKDRGTNMSSYFTTDKDGVSRPQGAAWDIGPYEGSGSTAGRISRADREAPWVQCSTLRRVSSRRDLSSIPSEGITPTSSHFRTPAPDQPPPSDSLS
jgi:hypothetical protein